MTFDPKGTEPGLASNTEAPTKLISMKCRREQCPGTQVTEVAISPTLEHAGVPHNRIYRCVKCGTTWNASVGGYVSI